MEIWRNHDELHLRMIQWKFYKSGYILSYFFTVSGPNMFALCFPFLSFEKNIAAISKKVDVLNTIRKDFPGTNAGLRIFFKRRKVGLKTEKF